jgi:hypothetical protein
MYILSLSISLKCFNRRPGAVAQVYNPSYLEGEDQKDCNLKSALAKSSQDPFSTNGWAWWHTPVIPAQTGHGYRLTCVKSETT